MELLTVTEAALRLKLGRSTTYLLCQRNVIPTIRIGKSVRVPANALDEWLARQVQLPGEDTPLAG